MTPDEASARIDKAVALIDAAIPGAPSSGPMSAQQLKYMRDVLTSYKRDLKAGSASADLGGSVLGRAIVDSWPLASQLGSAITGAENAYREAVEARE